MTDKLTYLSDNHQFAIAAITTKVSYLEHMIELTIAIALHGRQRTAKLALRRMGQGDGLIDLLKAALGDRAPSEGDNIAALGAFIKDVRTRRNEILHWMWGTTDAPKIATQGTKRPFRESKSAERTADDIYKIARDADRAAKKLDEWLDYLSGLNNPPSPGILSRPTLPTSLA